MNEMTPAERYLQARLDADPEYAAVYHSWAERLKPVDSINVRTAWVMCHEDGPVCVAACPEGDAEEFGAQGWWREHYLEIADRLYGHNTVRELTIKVPRDRIESLFSAPEPVQVDVDTTR